MTAKGATVATVGVLGGMGPEATNQLCALITAMTPVRGDQDHIPVITYNNSRIPDRSKAILEGMESPLPEMVRTARVLKSAGADFLVIPCNTAHHYIADISEAVDIPIINMVEETVAYTVNAYPHFTRIGLIATSPTVRSRLYDIPFAAHGRSLLVPPDEEQESKVMLAIYGEHGIKCGYKTGPRVLLTEAANRLVSRGAQAIIAGCTEVSLVIEQNIAPFIVIDPMEVLARRTVARALSWSQNGSASKSEALSARDG